MTGFNSKRRIALDRLDDDEIQIYAKPSRKRPVETDYASQVAYTRALELFCDTLAQPEQEPVVYFDWPPEWVTQKEQSLFWYVIKWLVTLCFVLGYMWYVLNPMIFGAGV